MDLTPQVGSSWFLIDNGRTEFEDQTSAGLSLNCASLLKPLYMWAAAKLPPYLDAPERWQNLAEAAIITSANDATSEVWLRCGPGNILCKLQELTGGTWQLSPGQSTWGAVRVDAALVALGYAALANSSDQTARRIVKWMSAVSNEHSFGIKQYLQTSLRLDDTAIAIKTGWFIGNDEDRIRTHIVAIIALPNGSTLGLVVLSAIPFAISQRNRYKKLYNLGTEVLSIHTQAAALLLQHEINSLIVTVDSRALRLMRVRAVQ